MRNFGAAFVVFTLIAYLIPVSVAASNDDIRRFKKCYAVFTSRMVDADHSLMAQVIAGTKTGGDACMELIASANLGDGDDNTMEKNDSGAYDREKQRVFQNIHFMHRNFFGIKDYSDPSLPTGVNLVSFSTLLRDINSDAYYWNYAFFKPGVKASNVVTANQSYASIRYLPTDDADEQRKKRLGVGSDTYDFTQGGWIDIETKLVDQGLLVGIKPDTKEFTANLIDSFHNSEMHGANANAHMGGGVIGSQVYIFSNFEKFGLNNKSTGGDIMNRRWSEHVMSDLMCKDLPHLRIEDVVSEVDAESPFFYRQSATCQQCHASMDPMAGYVRNIRTTGASSPFRPFFAMEMETTESALDTLLPFDTDEDFYKRPAQGRLVYRSYDGTLVNQISEGLDALGKQLSESNDFYACTAQKYYKHLTGVDVDLNDIGAATATPLSALATKHRQRVIDLGQQLKKDPDQNIQSIVKEIINTNTFVNAEIF